MNKYSPLKQDLHLYGSSGTTHVLQLKSQYSQLPVLLFKNPETPQVAIHSPIS